VVAGDLSARTFLEKKRKDFPDLEIQESTRKTGGESSTPFADRNPVCGYARFFDDDKFDVYSIRDPEDIKAYSCPDKLSTIRNGLKKFEAKPEVKKKSGKKGKRGGKNAKVEDDEETEETKKKEEMFNLRARLTLREQFAIFLFFNSDLFMSFFFFVYVVVILVKKKYFLVVKV
jgi:hypothetical protein